MKGFNICEQTNDELTVLSHWSCFDGSQRNELRDWTKTLPLDNLLPWKYVLFLELRWWRFWTHYLEKCWIGINVPDITYTHASCNMRNYFYMWSSADTTECLTKRVPLPNLHAYKYCFIKYKSKTLNFFYFFPTIPH